LFANWRGRVPSGTKGKAKPIKTSICLVDLAGSENAAMTKVNQAGVVESREINKSLISLGEFLSLLLPYSCSTTNYFVSLDAYVSSGRVVNALNENRRRTKGKQIPVPFRENPLTSVLRVSSSIL